MSTDYKFQGWLGLDPDCVKGKMVWKEYEPKEFDENDVDIKITHCGVCGSDIHTLRSGWAPTNYPACVGHEIVGHAVKVGSKVKGIKVGDRVGVGAQSGACMNQKGDCEACADGLQQHCPHMVQTYNDKWPSGAKSYGGYADYWRGQSDLVIPIPDGLPSDEAAPMLCGAITAFSPLTQNGAGPGKKVGIIGVGGLGHFGIMGAKALGCTEIIAISRSSSKKEDALKMGATGFIATDEEEDWATKHAGSLDLVVSTVSSPKMPLQQYLQLLRLKGKFVQVGAPEDVVPPINMFQLISKRVSIGGSLIGSPQEIKDMLKLFVEKGVHTWNVNVPMSEANKAVVDMDAGKARYRYVLVNEKHLK
ncbi:zinc-binding alcohol dehydrogenase [Exophiala viscosa]|uniref:alcohol dehydrogenase (NADP(+)) n=1 Tax=Exophiala viscosa TaxID=2486360 RepID=A0AAN6E4V2_9EURO|nr:zinc-binding alcohol dehydrogenase [Exophiala viscosa]KAI1629536.1 zinc-binding alcohol dehydrogenase [Exophiala viscosa]